MKKLLIGACVGTLVAMPCMAEEYITLTTGDAKDSNSFVKEGHWSDGAAPHGDADYLVALGSELQGSLGMNVALRTPANGATSIVFGGRSLTIGDAETGVEGMILQKAGQTAATTWPDLRLVAGCYSQGSEYNNPPQSILWGDWTVLSGGDNPFSLLGANNRYFYVGATLHGGAESVLRICHSATEPNGIFTVRLAGTNTTYNGSLVVRDAGAYLELVGDTDLLGAPDSPNNDQAVVLTDRGGLRTETLEPVDVDPNKKFVVSSTRGRIFAAANQEGKIAVPFVGEGVLEKWGAGRVVLGGSLGNVGGLQVLQGELDLDDAVAFADGYPVTVGSDGTFTGEGQTGVLTGDPATLAKLSMTVGPGGSLIARAATDTMTLAGAKFAGGGVMARTDLAAGVCSLTVLDASAEVAWPLALALDQPFPGFDGPDAYPIVKVPTALKTVTPDDFVNVTQGADIGLPRVGVAVEEDENGDQIVSLKRTRRVVEMTANGDTNYFFATATQWSDQEIPHPGADYLVYATTAAKALRTGDANLQVATFEGDSLTMKGTGGNRANLTLKAETTTVDDLTMFGNTAIGLAGYKNSASCNHNLYGKLHVRSTRTEPLQISNDSNRQLHLYAELDGPADSYLLVKAGNGNNGIRRHFFYAMNTNFYGSIFLSQQGLGTPGPAKYQEISIACEENLGGNPPAPVFDMLTLAYWSRLACRGSVTIDDPNRGILFDAASQLFVEDGETLTLKSPLTFNARVYKQGTGRLALGAPLAFGAKGTDAGPTADKNWLLMTEGSLQALTSRALDGLKVDYTGNTPELIVDLQAGDDSLREEGVVTTYATPFVVDEGSSLVVKLQNVAPRRGSFQVPVLTLAAEAADALRDRLLFEAKLSGYLVDFEEESLGDTVRFNAVFTDVSGTAVIVR